MSKYQYRPDNPTLLTGELFIPRCDSHGNVQVTYVGTYNATPPVLVDGQTTGLQYDSSGNLKVVEANQPLAEDNANGVIWVCQRPLATATNSWSRTSSASGGIGTAGASIKGSAGRVRYVSVTNANATTGFYFGLYNKATAPVNSDVPVERKYVPPQTTSSTTTPSVIFDFGPEGFSFATGIGVAASSTVGSLTLLGATDAHYTIYYI